MKLATVVVASLVVAAWFATPSIRRFVAIDSCLDHSGTWDYDTGACSGAR